jgi:hypothetical protein
MESGLDWGVGSSRISPTWDLHSVNTAALSVPLDSGRNAPWGLGSSEVAGTHWSSGSNSLVSRGLDPSSMLVGSKSTETMGSDLWRAGSWNRLDERQLTNNRPASMGSASWGKVPVCQGTGWDSAVGGGSKDSLRMAGDSETILNGNSCGSNDGTDIWRTNLAKSNVGLAAVGTPGGIRNMTSGSDGMSWVGRDVHSASLDGMRQTHHSASASLDGMRQALHSAPLQPQIQKPAWDSNGTNIWGSASSDALAVPPVPSGMPVSSRVVNYSALRRSPSLSSGTWNTADSPEADFGHWSQSSGAAGVTPAQQKIDNGTAVWGAPPALAEGFGSTRPAADAQPSMNLLPFSIDFSVPPPPVFKMSSAPAAPGMPANYWNPTLQPVSRLFERPVHCGNVT